MRPTFLVISQVYVPDPASVGQHVADAAAEMARRGYRVVVYTSARGYDDPGRKYPAREQINGVDVRRLPLSSFGKRSIAVRLVAQGIFLVQAVARGLFTRGLVGVLVSTSPPFCGVGGAVIGMVRGVSVKYWLMDLNPDQMVALGRLAPTSLAVRVFDWMNRIILRRADRIVVLDRFMLERVERKGVAVADKTVVMPPWPHEEPAARIAHADNPFRTRHGLDGRFVVMYSGNHSPANPITTILDAAERLQDEERLVFMFIGGGAGKREVEERIARGVRNIRSLPYQPLAEIGQSLSAADVHVVSVGPEVVGIVHPCKVYGAMAVGRPILLVGPEPCHVSDLIERNRVGWRVAHGDVEMAARLVRGMLSADPVELAAMGERAAGVIRTQLSKAALQARFCDVLEEGLRRRPGEESRCDVESRTR